EAHSLSLASGLRAGVTSDPLANYILTANATSETCSWRRLSGSTAPGRGNGPGSAARLRDSLAPAPALPADLRCARRDDGRHARRDLAGAAAAGGMDAAQNRAPRENLGRSAHAHPLHRARGGE